MSTTEFAPASETLTATISMSLPTGDSYQGPVHIGYYNGSNEVFIECEGLRLNILDGYLEQLVKQLRRACKLAKEVQQ